MLVIPASKNPNEKLYIGFSFLAFVILMYIMIYSKGCSNNQYNVQHGARMGISAMAIDSTPPLSDTTKFLSIGDLYRLAQPYGDKVTGTQWDAFKNIFNAIMNDAIKEWDAKHPKPKK
jgi:hypothetical protein